jgi:putative FmdB family regulatory protein
MPIYEYKCEKCGVFEATQKITGKALSRCPTCKGKVKKLISNTSFQLKGSGWYATDYARKEKAPKGEKADKAPAAEAKGDGKPAAASDAKEKPAAEKSSANATSSDSTTP